ncbi:hypothetical protein C0J52_20885 [Blattella germanica]|nr:hypothetical protein C0J52_20885 [Blattella germanica]
MNVKNMCLWVLEFKEGRTSCDNQLKRYAKFGCNAFTLNSRCSKTSFFTHSILVSDRLVRG